MWIIREIATTLYLKEIKVCHISQQYSETSRTLESHKAQLHGLAAPTPEFLCHKDSPCVARSRLISITITRLCLLHKNHVYTHFICQGI